jgi:2-polyprenyl-3-methyl-5-hydroxy-6-metoxy-1,4-benzoquinol methylase
LHRIAAGPHGSSDAAKRGSSRMNGKLQLRILDGAAGIALLLHDAAEAASRPNNVRTADRHERCVGAARQAHHPLT